MRIIDATLTETNNDCVMVYKIEMSLDEFGPIQHKICALKSQENKQFTFPSSYPFDCVELTAKECATIGINLKPLIVDFISNFTPNNDIALMVQQRIKTELNIN